jgi:hypothetical protein
LTAHFRLVSWCCLFGVGLFLVGCSSGSKTRLRVVNAVVDESDLNVLNDGTSVAGNFGIWYEHRVPIRARRLTPDSNRTIGNLINVSPSLGTADVYIVSPATDINTVSPTISNFAFGSASTYQSLAAGNYEIIYAFASQKITAIDSGSLSLSAGQVRTFVGLNGQSGGFTDALLADVN